GGERREEGLLQVADLSVYFATRRSLAQMARGQAALPVKAVDGINLEAARQQTLGIVGESGSGKTTLARAIIGLAERTAGDIRLLGLSLPPKLSRRHKDLLQQLQYVFQNPEEALNPYLTVGETLRRPFITLAQHTRAEADTAVQQLLTAVRLPTTYAQRLPSQLSGGEKQRVAIARAFATHPDLLIADEAVSALDVSVQASILNLLSELQHEHHNTLLFISHDLAVVGYLADEIAVVYVGQLMEVAAAAALFAPPYHPYTEALLSSIPLATPDAAQQQIRLQGDVPSQINKPSGCPFHPRCPRYLGEICARETPPWQTHANGKRIFCHIPLSELTRQQAQLIALETPETGVNTR
ncbi:MAG: ABC transporter ATP-binding protein, partial [Anaerolineales bacterium]|nr:ABC transporter ATP-binding protein [Anaerolineales bacterium]